MLDIDYLRVIIAYIKARPDAEMIELPRSSIIRLIKIARDGCRDYDPDVPKDQEELEW